MSESSFSHWAPRPGGRFTTMESGRWFNCNYWLIIWHHFGLEPFQAWNQLAGIIFACFKPKLAFTNRNKAWSAAEDESFTWNFACARIRTAGSWGNSHFGNGLDYNATFFFIKQCRNVLIIFCRQCGGADCSGKSWAVWLSSREVQPSSGWCGSGPANCWSSSGRRLWVDSGADQPQRPASCGGRLHQRDCGLLHWGDQLWVPLQGSHSDHWPQ